MIKKELAEILKKAWGDDVFLDYPVNNQFGDLATNFAILHKEKSANDLVGLIPKIDWLEKIEIAGAGFINFMIKPAKLIEEIDREIEKVEKTMVIDYSAPNIAKPFGIGHLRSTN
ncbi:MAG TPA: arginine--tRNA ligase, partial [Candidatus Woesebacteria bacterium]|nr:arginine--tRNA ligase [Candidatus Woesebacteria bacterium]